MPGITTADLFKMQEVITDTLRHEVGQLRSDFAAAVKELKESQRTQDERADGHARELARLEERTRIAARSFLGALSPKQKAALWSAGIAGVGVVVDGVRHVAVLGLTLWAKSKGLHP